MVLREVLVPTGLGFVTYTFLLLMRGIFGLMEEIFVRGVSLKDALQLLSATVPHVVVLTIPMSYLFGVLIAMGRLNSDSEVTALQAAGVSLRRVLRPIVLFSLLLAGVNGYLTMDVMPAANRELSELRARLFSSTNVLARVEPRVFYEGFPNVLLYVGGIDRETSYWRNVIMFDRSNPGYERLIVARRGLLVNQIPSGMEGTPGGPGPDAPTSRGEPWLLLEDVVTHQFNPAKPETYRINENQSWLYRLFPKEETTQEISFGMRERATGDLVATVVESSPGPALTAKGQPTERRQALVELQKRVAIPMACVAFALIALPLGVGSRSGGRGRGFILSIVVILVYYVMLNNGELLARQGKTPVWLGIWLPNLALAVLALVLLRRTGRWLGERRDTGWLASAVQWWGRRRRRSAMARAELRRPVTGSIPALLQRRQLVTRFPTLLDRYVVTRLAAPLTLVLASTSALYVVVDLADKIDEIAKHTAGLGTFLAYYWNLLPQVILDVAPFALMIAVLILLTMLERRLELTAVKAAGISLYRVMVPVLLVAAASASGLWMLQESVVPRANRQAQRLLDRIKGREVARSYSATDRQWLFSRDGSTLYNFLRYDPTSQTLVRFTMFRFDQNMQLRFHLFADRVQYRDGRWVADSGWFRQLFPDGTDHFSRITSPLELAVSEDPSYFGHEYRQPAEMSFRELSHYIAELRASGYRPVKLIVRLQQKLTYPLSVFIMVLLALPFGLNRGGRRATTMQGVALALGLGIGYFLVVALFGKMSEARILPPLVGAWAPVALASLFAVNRISTLRT